MSLIECVPNFSEGRDESQLQQIAAKVRAVPGIVLLEYDMGPGVHRSVVTFAGTPPAVEEAAFRAIEQALGSIDMRRHSGVHPRIGAADVCPFIPLHSADMADCIAMAARVGQRVGSELQIPVYLYAEAARIPARRRLVELRRGGYEALPERLRHPDWQPDFGPAQFVPRSGAIAIGARPVLVAYNITLNTRDSRIAGHIAGRLRESGRKSSGPEGSLHHPGLFRHLQAIGWFVESYNRAQISMNITNYRETPLHLVYLAAARLAEQYDVALTGSEVIGMLPRDALLAAGHFFSPAAGEQEAIDLAIEQLRLNDVQAFNPQQKLFDTNTLLRRMRNTDG